MNVVYVFTFGWWTLFVVSGFISTLLLWQYYMYYYTFDSTSLKFFELGGDNTTTILVKLNY